MSPVPVKESLLEYPMRSPNLNSRMSPLPVKEYAMASCSLPHSLFLSLPSCSW